MRVNPYNSSGLMLNNATTAIRGGADKDQAGNNPFTYPGQERQQQSSPQGKASVSSVRTETTAKPLASRPTPVDESKLVDVFA